MPRHNPAQRHDETADDWKRITKSSIARRIDEVAAQQKHGDSAGADGLHVVAAPIVLSQMQTERRVGWKSEHHHPHVRMFGNHDWSVRRQRNKPATESSRVRRSE